MSLVENSPKKPARKRAAIAGIVSQVGMQMPKFHFEIVDGYKIEDPVGLECKNEEQAKSVAQDIARQIAIDLVGARSRTIIVIDDDGREILKIPSKT